MPTYRVTNTLEGRHPLHKDYPLLPGDIISPQRDGWTKHAPGLGVTGFQLTDGDLADACELADGARWTIA